MTKDSDRVLLPTALAALFEFWLGSSEASSPPHISEITPQKLRRWLGTLSLFDIELSPFRIRIRLQGTQMSHVFGMESTGKYLDEILPARFSPRIQADFDRIIKNRRPLHQWGTCNLGAQTAIPFHRLLLPYVDDNNVVSRIMGTLSFSGLHGRTIPYANFAKAVDASQTRAL